VRPPYLDETGDRRAVKINEALVNLVALRAAYLELVEKHEALEAKCRELERRVEREKTQSRDKRGEGATKDEVPKMRM
jgi:hypothetical protein